MTGRSQKSAAAVRMPAMTTKAVVCILCSEAVVILTIHLSTATGRAKRTMGSQSGDPWFGFTLVYTSEGLQIAQVGLKVFHPCGYAARVTLGSWKPSTTTEPQGEAKDEKPLPGVGLLPFAGASEVSAGGSSWWRVVG